MNDQNYHMPYSMARNNGGPLILNSGSHPGYAPVKMNVKTANDMKISKSRAPEKPIAPYMRYSKKVWDSVKSQHPDAKLWEIGKIIGNMWRDLNEAEKAEYIAEYEHAKAEYCEQIKAYHNSPQYQHFLSNASRKKGANEPRHSSANQNVMSSNIINTLNNNNRSAAVNDAGLAHYAIEPAEDDGLDDNQTSRQMSLGRYSRNHRLLNEIFNEYTVADNRSIVTSQRMEQLKKQVGSLEMHQKKLNQELENIEERFLAKKKKMMEASGEFEKELDKLEKFSVEEEKLKTFYLTHYEQLEKQWKEVIERSKTTSDNSAEAFKANIENLISNNKALMTIPAPSNVNLIALQQIVEPPVPTPQPQPQPQTHTPQTQPANQSQTQSQPQTQQQTQPQPQTQPPSQPPQPQHTSTLPAVSQTAPVAQAPTATPPSAQPATAAPNPPGHSGYPAANPQNMQQMMHQQHIMQQQVGQHHQASQPPVAAAQQATPGHQGTPVAQPTIPHGPQQAAPNMLTPPVQPGGTDSTNYPAYPPAGPATGHPPYPANQAYPGQQPMPGIPPQAGQYPGQPIYPQQMHQHQYGMQQQYQMQRGPAPFMGPQGAPPGGQVPGQGVMNRPPGPNGQTSQAYPYMMPQFNQQQQQFRSTNTPPTNPASNSIGANAMASPNQPTPASTTTPTPATATSAPTPSATPPTNPNQSPVVNRAQPPQSQPGAPAAQQVRQQGPANMGYYNPQMGQQPHMYHYQQHQGMMQPQQPGYPMQTPAGAVPQQNPVPNPNGQPPAGQPPAGMYHGGQIPPGMMYSGGQQHQPGMSQYPMQPGMNPQQAMMMQQQHQMMNNQYGMYPQQGMPMQQQAQPQPASNASPSQTQQTPTTPAAETKAKGKKKEKKSKTAAAAPPAEST